MKEELKKAGWNYPEDPEPQQEAKIEYMHDGEISEGVYVGRGLVDDKKHTDLYQTIDLWRQA